MPTRTKLPAPGAERAKPCFRSHPVDRSYWNGYAWCCRACQSDAHRKQLTDDPDGYRERARTRARKQRRALKQEVVAAYGGCCACPGCNVTDWRKLTVDHVNGDGASFRKKPGSAKFYYHLKAAGFPRAEYQLMCWTCNAVKHFYPGEVCCPA